MSRAADRRFRRYALHGYRIVLFATILLLIHSKSRQAFQSSGVTPALQLPQVIELFPRAGAIGPADVEGVSSIFDESGERLGYVLQTSPTSDHIVGFSGPSNVLVAFGSDDKIVGIQLLSSRDTRDHVATVTQNERFNSSWNGLNRDEVSAANVDAVSGATLTSLAIAEAIIHRLGGSGGSLRFPDPPSIEYVQKFFSAAQSLEQSAELSFIWRVFDFQENEIGKLLRTTPAADNIVGYQGPTDTLVGLDAGGKIAGMALGHSYDNQPYVGYVRDDDYFLSVFDGLSLEELAALDPAAAQIEGVSGATMTSLAVADGVIAAARNYNRLRSVNKERQQSRSSFVHIHDIGTGLVILAAITIGFSSLRSKKLVRLIFQIALIAYLGLVAGNMVSMAMLVGWSQHGVPWQSAAGLALLTVAALTAPATTRSNLYCSHICPHGAAQQLLKQVQRRRVRLSIVARTILSLLPAFLLLWCIIVGMTSLGFSLVDIEPFDAYVFRIAGWATIAVAVVGLAASLFVPMAYCRYGCPTGALLNYLRLNAKSDRWTMRDSVALSYLLLAIALWSR